jgi:hypothetical protein
MQDELTRGAAELRQGPRKRSPSLPRLDQCAGYIKFFVNVSSFGIFWGEMKEMKAEM